MTLHLVYHHTEAPALDAMLAGVLAAEIGATFLVLDTGGGGLGAYEARQHVLRTGALAANGLFWYEWASGRAAPPALPPAVIAQHPDETLLVPVNTAVAAQSEMADRLLALAARAGRPCNRITVRDTADGGWHLAGGRPPGVAPYWHRDGYGRPQPQGPAAPARALALRLLIVGSALRLSMTYPAVLAALGDAADALGVQVAVTFWDPAEADETDLPDALDCHDGIILPGGADMGQVAGQIRVARQAITADIALLGLCLGMQTMTTAVAQLHGGFNDANMEEVAPGATTKVFRRLDPSEVAGAFRIGTDLMRPVPGTRLAAILGRDDPVSGLFNHRYVLDPALHAPLQRAGLRIAAWQARNTALADAVELPRLNFCLGLQGHPELQTRRGAPHPVFSAFLTAAAAVGT